LSYGHVVSLRADPDDDAGSLLCAPDGQVLARLTLRDDDGEQVAARVQPVVRPLAAVVAQAAMTWQGCAWTQLTTIWPRRWLRTGSPVSPGSRATPLS
jgi:hypothetical protein